MSILIDGETLTTAGVHAIADGAEGILGDAARARMNETSPFAEPVLRQKWEWLVGGDAPADDAVLMTSFVHGHCAGTGSPLPAPLVRATLAARANVLAKGFSGVRPMVVEGLLRMLKENVVPQVPRQGSVGTAGCPALSHMASVVLGLGGEAWVSGELRSVETSYLAEAATQKEVLSLINGSTLTTALAAIAVERSRRILAVAMQAAALSFEVVRADTSCLDAEVLGLRGQPGGVVVAERIRAALAGSGIVGAWRKPDAFGIRCTPAVLGAAYDAVEATADIVNRELNGACDNPLVLPGGRVVEAGNFHAAPIALALDHLKIAMAQVAGISERRTFRMTHGRLSGLPSYLAESTGLNSGLMLAQYTAASRTSETKGLAHPASVDSIPTIQHREDHVSMGPGAAYMALELLEATADVVGIELLCGAQGVDLHFAAGEGPLGEGTSATHAAVRERVRTWDRDRVLHPDLSAMSALVRGTRLVGVGPAW
ncbi:MAG: histidine ammonia-lyase [Myxococcota bacterium]|jgi:histidine ammonia-lyase